MFFVTGCSSGYKGNNDENVLVFKNVSVIDAVNGLRDSRNVIIKGNRIVAEGAAEDTMEPSGATVIDCNGKYLIPGLWDAHVHLGSNKDLIPVISPLFIVNGITYVRDVGGDLDLLLKLRREAEEASYSGGLAPRIFMSGPILRRDCLSNISVEQALSIVDSLIDAGVDQIKLYELVPNEIFFEVVSHAKEKGFKVSAHVPGGMDVIEASNAGLGSMEHMFGLETSCSADWDSLLKARQQMIVKYSERTESWLRREIYREQRMHAFRTQDDERREKVLSSLADNNTWVVPTMIVLTLADPVIYNRADWRETYRYLPEPLRSDWAKNAISEEGIIPASVYRWSDSREEMITHARWAYDMIPRLAEAGVGIMAGTDTPLIMLTPGFSLHEELILLVRAGLTPLQAIESATLQPAVYFGVDDQQGSIAKGMMADMVLLDANPLEDIANTQRINAVIREGHMHTRDNLDEILDELASPGP